MPPSGRHLHRLGQAVDLGLLQARAPASRAAAARGGCARSVRPPPGRTPASPAGASWRRCHSVFMSDRFARVTSRPDALDLLGVPEREGVVVARGDQDAVRLHRLSRMSWAKSRAIVSWARLAVTRLPTSGMKASASTGLARGPPAGRGAAVAEPVDDAPASARRGRRPRTRRRRRTSRRRSSRARAPRAGATAGPGTARSRT